MLETPHGLLGAAVGAATGNPYAAGPAAFASHLAGDFLPHWNPEFPFHSKSLYAFVIADFTVAMLLTPAFLIIFPHQPEIAVGAFFGCLPDIILGLRYTLKIRWLRPYERMHAAMQWDVPITVGLIPQGMVSLLSMLYLAGQ